MKKEHPENLLDADYKPKTNEELNMADPSRKNRRQATEDQLNNPLHGVKLKQILERLVAYYNWEYLAERVDIRCFKFNPTMKSSLGFLRRTRWAREQVEGLYMEMIDEKELVQKDVQFEIRLIQEKDNEQMAKVIRKALEDFNANKPGTAYFDPSTDDLFTLFKEEKSTYFVAVIDDNIIGGSGIFPTANLPAGYTELVKIYINSSYRGLGIGKALMHKCFEKAIQFGNTHIYLESMPELDIAVGMYEKMGFTFLKKPLGESGHFGCNLWMEKKL